jgi:hypothetical protein
MAATDDAGWRSLYRMGGIAFLMAGAWYLILTLLLLIVIARGEYLDSSQALMDQIISTPLLPRLNAAFQQELAIMYKEAPQGQPPIPPAQLALATILQAYTGVSDAELIEATIMDRRWQLVLDCLETETPPFSKPTLIAFRQRLIATQMDRRLLQRTIELAAATKAFGSRQLRAALSSSPLWGAGKVEDTFNLLGHA